LLVLNISRIFVELRIEHRRVIEIKFSIIIERFVGRQRDQEREKKINKFEKISNIEKLRKYKRLLILVLREKSKLCNFKLKN